MNEVSLYNKHHEFHSKLDYVETPNLSIKEISKRIYFAIISTDKQILTIKEMFSIKQKMNLLAII